MTGIILTILPFVLTFGYASLKPLANRTTLSPRNSNSHCPCQG